MSALLDAINAELVHVGYVVSTAGQPATGDIVSKYGTEYLQENDRPPRLVIEPGGPADDSTGPTVRVGGNARQLLTLIDRYKAHCWGRDEDDARLLADEVRRALIKTAHGSITWGASGCTPIRDIHKGVEYVFAFNVNRPLLEKAYANPTGLRAAVMYEMEFDASTFVSCIDQSRPFTAAISDVCTLVGHGLTNGQVVTVRNTGGALPGGLVAGHAYYVVAATADTFQLSLTSGGAAVDLTSTGTGVQFLVGPATP